MGCGRLNIVQSPVAYLGSRNGAKGAKLSHTLVLLYIREFQQEAGVEPDTWKQWKGGVSEETRCPSSGG